MLKFNNTFDTQYKPDTNPQKFSISSDMAPGKFNKNRYQSNELISTFTYFHNMLSIAFWEVVHDVKWKQRWEKNENIKAPLWEKQEQNRFIRAEHQIRRELLKLTQLFYYFYTFLNNFSLLAQYQVSFEFPRLIFLIHHPADQSKLTFEAMLPRRETRCFFFFFLCRKERN